MFLQSKLIRNQPLLLHSPGVGLLYPKHLQRQYCALITGQPSRFNLQRVSSSLYRDLNDLIQVGTELSKQITTSTELTESDKQNIPESVNAQFKSVPGIEEPKADASEAEKGSTAFISVSEAPQDQQTILKKLDLMAEKAEDYVEQKLFDLGAGIKTQITSLLAAPEVNKYIDGEEPTEKEEGILDKFDKLADQAEDRVIKSFYSFGSNLKSGINSLLKKPVDEQKMLIYDRKTLDLIAVGKDPDTFLNDPVSGSPERHTPNSSPSAILSKFNTFKLAYDPVSNAGKVSRFLTECKEIDEFYKKFGSKY
jgi:hypothetical protein